MHANNPPSQTEFIFDGQQQCGGDQVNSAHLYGNVTADVRQHTYQTSNFHTMAQDSHDSLAMDGKSFMQQGNNLFAGHTPQSRHN